MTSSWHRCLGLPTGLVPIGFQSSGFLVGLAWSILWICPSHLILCALMNLTISAPSIKLSISMSFRIIHTLSILTGPNIFLNICLSKMRRWFSSFAMKSFYTTEILTVVLLLHWCRYRQSISTITNIATLLGRKLNQIPQWHIHEIHLRQCAMPIPTAARSQEWVHIGSLAGIAGSNLTGNIHVCLLWILSSRALCDGLVPHPEESYRPCVRACARARVCVCVGGGHLVWSGAAVTIYT